MDITVTLKNEEKVKVNDHVYCSPSWSVRDGTPYSVARIMEFLPPEDANKGKGKGKEIYTRVRLAWYYRPSDVSDRAVADSRLLLAAIYSEVCDISQLRAKCYVMHRDKLTDLSGWKKRPDRFYFHRLFDPYIKKEFEVLLSSDVRNLPQHIKEVLQSRYEYVVAEKDIVPDLTDSLRLCKNCGEWCPNADAVKCDSCKSYFHMGCVQPPLLSKPSRGYGWTCAPCSRRHEDKVDNGEARTPTPPIPKVVKPVNGPTRGRGRPRKDKSLNPKVDDDIQVKHYKLWPFRYFGLYTVAEDTLDPNDLIFPRAATRVGPKYQATVPAQPDSTIPPDIEERGGPATIEILSNVVDMREAEVGDMEKYIASWQPRKDLLFNTDWLTETTRRFSQAYVSSESFQTVSMKRPMRREKWKTAEIRYTDREWNDEEVAAFENGIAQHGAELRFVKDEIGTRTMAEVVRFYGKWKNARLREENARNRSLNGSTKQDDQIRLPSPPPMSDDESIINVPIKHSVYCAACRSRESKKWWKAPKGLPTNVLCDSCGLNWRKYADLNARPITREEPSIQKKTVEKREGTPLTASTAKRIKIITAATGPSTVLPTPSTSSPPPVPPPVVIPQLRCLSCFKQGPLGKVLKCKECGFIIHAGACGAVVEPQEADGWVCDLCQNEKSLEASLTTDCLLCPRRSTSAKNAPISVYPPADSYLRACKPTEGQGWVHVLCSIFTQETSFADTVRLRLVEGISTVPKNHWTTRCILCSQEGGAVVRCANCPKEYHVSCAWKFGHRFGFEIQPVKSTRRDITSIVTFKRETGCMNAIICCKEHSSYRRDLYDICETNEVGETALQIYARTYKQASTAQSHALLRKARRLDQILNLPNADALSFHSEDHNTTTAPAAPRCSTCKTEFSPLFYPIQPPKLNGSLTNGTGHNSIKASTAWLCHRCHFTQDQTSNSHNIVLT